MDGVDKMRFDKYVGAGNDFIIFNHMEDSYEDYGGLALKACHRQFGIGADGILVCKKSHMADIKMLYYNSDGSQGEMCGNGIRCFSKYIFDHGLVKKDRISIETLNGIKYIDIVEKDRDNKAAKTKVDMGLPSFSGQDIPVNIKKEYILDEVINIDKKNYNFAALNMGVPHVVIFPEKISDIDINDLGRKIEFHSLFPQKTNVNFVEIIDRRTINIYTWERGAGRTLGCGTGSCASVIVGNLKGRLESRVQVNTEGGRLEVELGKDYRPFMIGDGIHIARGDFLNF